MESLFLKRGPNVTVKLRNNHNTYLAANNSEKSLILISPTVAGFTPVNAEWTMRFHSTTSQFTEFSLWSIYNKELAAYKGVHGEIVVCQKKPNSSRPFYWRSDNSQPPSGGLYLFCDCESGDWVFNFYKLSATQDRTIVAKPSFVDTSLDPGSWWFIEVVEKITPESGSISNHAPETCSTSSVLHQPSNMPHQFSDMEQQHGGFKIKSKFSVTNPGHGRPPYNHEGPCFGNSPPEMQAEQPPYDPEDHTNWFIPDKPEYHPEQPPYDPEHHPQSEYHSGASFPRSHNPGNSRRDARSTRPNFGAPHFSTCVHNTDNTNYSGTQNNDVKVINKGPIYKYG